MKHFKEVYIGILNKKKYLTGYQIITSYNKNYCENLLKPHAIYLKTKIYDMPLNLTLISCLISFV